VGFVERLCFVQVVALNAWPTAYLPYWFYIVPVSTARLNGECPISG
jgi:hypothetical protein